MAKTTNVKCDYPGCEVTTEMTGKAGSLENWTRRDVIDSYNKRLAEGMRDFTARETQYLCPEHTEGGIRLPSLPTHREVIQFSKEREPIPLDGINIRDNEIRS